MPTRSYYFPTNFSHLEEILKGEPEGFPEEQELYFKQKAIPPITSVGALPLFLGISPKTIFSIRLQTRKHYRSFKLAKRDGTMREIDTPRTYLKVIQWWILDNILGSVKVADNVFGFVAGRSAIQNARYHQGAAHILNVDIKQFFPSITSAQVEKIFSDIGYNELVAKMLAELCCLNGHVPQGAPTSPALANLVLKNLDSELSLLASTSGIKYSRYADDLTFSSEERIAEAFLSSVSKAVEKEGFSLKSKKTRFAGHGDRMEVTGIIINKTLQPNRVWRKNTRAKLHRLSLAIRLTRRELYYLYGIHGTAKQFPDSLQMQSLADATKSIIETKSQTVVGHGSNPILPAGLTLRQAEALARLTPRRTNFEVAISLETTEAAVKKRLQGAFKKIGVSDRQDAERWASENI
jgi:RNA-directed DNA polymerase